MNDEHLSNRLLELPSDIAVELPIRSTNGSVQTLTPVRVMRGG